MIITTLISEGSAPNAERTGDRGRHVVAGRDAFQPRMHADQAEAEDAYKAQHAGDDEGAQHGFSRVMKARSVSTGSWNG
jgi:hypothetical protein